MITFQDLTAYFGISIVVLLVMFCLRKRVSVVIFLSLITLITIKTFTGTPFAFVILKIITLQRWAVYFGFILLGLLGQKSLTASKLPKIHMFHFLYLSMLFITIFYSINPGLTIQRAIAMVLLYVATFYGIYNCIDNYKTIVDICKKMVLFSVFINVVPWFFMKDISVMFVLGRYAGIINSATGSAALNVFLFPLALTMYHMTKKKRYICIAIILVGFIFLSYARTAFIVLVLALIFYYAQYFRKMKYAVTLFGILAVLTSIFSFFVFGIWLPGRLVRIETLGGLGGRLIAWGAANSIISKRPITGFGFGTEELLFDYCRMDVTGHGGKYFHNSLLGLAAQIGIPFTIFYFIGVFYFFLFCLRFSETIDHPKKRILAIGFNTLLLIGVLYCFAESYIYSPGNFLAFIFFMIGAVYLKMIAFEENGQMYME